MRKRFLGDGKDGIMKLSVIRRKEIVIKKKLDMFNKVKKINITKNKQSLFLFNKLKKIFSLPNTFFLSSELFYVESFLETDRFAIYQIKKKAEEILCN